MIVVTGGGGFLGGAIVRQLVERGESVRSVQRSDAASLRALSVEVVRADLSDAASCLEALRGAEAVIHVAAKAGVWGSRASFYAANVTATDNVISACSTLGIGKLVYTSTPSVVHSGGDVENLDETAPIATHFEAPYPETKAIAEAHVLAANGPTLSTVALRPHLIWGPGDTQLTARVLERGRAGRLRLVGGGDKLIDSVYIDNAAAAHLNALDRLRPGAACAGKAYFITQGEPMAQKLLINGMLAAAGLPPCNKSIAPGVAWVAGAVLEFAWWLLGRQDEPMMTRFVAKQLATAHWFNIEAARRDLGYEPRVTVEQGLRRLGESLDSCSFGGS
jgi:nucleoside-diphosphate-sugar epimerase